MCCLSNCDTEVTLQPLHFTELPDMWFSTSSVLSPDARLILSSSLFLLKKYEFTNKLSSDGYVVYLWTVTEVDYASQQGKK